MGEAVFMVREKKEAAYLATVYDGNPTLEKHKTVLISQICGKVCVLNLGIWNINKFGESLLTQVYQQEGRS
jgi:hypothetical protein